MSRGAGVVCFVEQDRRAVAAIRANLDSTGLAAAPGVRVVRAEVLEFLAREAGTRYDLALVDPPYSFDGWRFAARPVSKAELAVLESSAPVEVPEHLSRSAASTATAVRSSRWSKPSGPAATIPEPPRRAPCDHRPVPGSFDPFHNGHLEIAERASRLFDALVVAVVRNPQKGEPLFDADDRQAMIAESLAHLGSVRIVSMSTLVVEVAREVGADRDRARASERSPTSRTSCRWRR